MTINNNSYKVGFSSSIYKSTRPNKYKQKKKKKNL